MPVVKTLGDFRVSADEQAREGWSLDVQQLYSRLQGLDLIAIIADEGISAWSPRDARFARHAGLRYPNAALVLHSRVYL